MTESWSVQRNYFNKLFSGDVMSDEEVIRRLTQMGYLTNYMTAKELPTQRHRRSISNKMYGKLLRQLSYVMVTPRCGGCRPSAQDRICRYN